MKSVRIYLNFKGLSCQIFIHFFCTMTQPSKDENECVKEFKAIYDNPDSYNGDKLTAEACHKLEQLDYTKFDIDDIKVVQSAEKLPDDLAVSILKGWMRRQDDLLLNLRGNLIYTPRVKKERLEQFVKMMRCPTSDCKNNLIVENILYQIATGGGLRNADAVPLIDPSNLENGIIRFEHSKVSGSSDSDVQNLLDFKKETYYHNRVTKDPFFIIGLPSFMKVRLTKYKLIGPPQLSDRKTQGGPKNWEFFGSNDWDEIKNRNPQRIDLISNDTNLREPNAEHDYEVTQNDDQYYRYFKFVSTGMNHQGSLEIFLSGIDLTGNIIICRE